MALPIHGNLHHMHMFTLVAKALLISENDEKH
jgi:hypothetical protein